MHYWRPHTETGGASTNTKGLERPSWNTYCSPQPRDFKFERYDDRGKAYSYGSAVKFKGKIGIDLSISREYSTSQSLFYKFDDGVRHKLGGNNDYPSMAGKMIDRFL